MPQGKPCSPVTAEPPLCLLIHERAQEVEQYERVLTQELIPRARIEGERGGGGRRLGLGRLKTLQTNGTAAGAIKVPERHAAVCRPFLTQACYHAFQFRLPSAVSGRGRTCTCEGNSPKDGGLARCCLHRQEEKRGVGLETLLDKMGMLATSGTYA